MSVYILSGGTFVAGQKLIFDESKNVSEGKLITATSWGQSGVKGTCDLVNLETSPYLTTFLWIPNQLNVTQIKSKSHR